MTAKEIINTKGKYTKIVLKAYMTKQSLSEQDPVDWECKAEDALAWYKVEYHGLFPLVARIMDAGSTKEQIEERISKRIIERLLYKSEVWKRIFETCEKELV